MDPTFAKSHPGPLNDKFQYQTVPNPAPGVYYNGYPTQDHGPVAVGLPQNKQFLNWIDTSALLGGFIALGGCIAVLSPVGSWHLGYNLQITVIGLLLSMQVICLRRNVGKLFLVVEARFGLSTIQNYDAIRTNSILTDNTSPVWRSLLIFFIILPIGLSLAYKQFPGGISSRPVSPLRKSPQAGFYGINAPPGTYEFGSRFGVSLMTNITLPFVSTTTNDSINPATVASPDNPKPFGFNTLMLSSDQVAILDAPHPLYISSIQASLGEKDSYELTATVNATISQRNTTIDQRRNDPRFWDAIAPIEMNGVAGRITLFQGFQLWMRTGVEEEATGPQRFGHRDRFPILIGLLRDDSNIGDAALNQTFYQVAQMVSVWRRSCRGTWTITPSSVQLQSGRCFLDDATATPWGSGFHFDGLGLRMLYLPSLLEYLGPFANISTSFAAQFGGTRLGSPWWPATLASVTGNMVWSRNAALGLLSTAGSATVKPSAKYAVGDSATSTRATVRASAWLFVVVSVLPALNAAAWALNMLFFRSPIDAHFNAVALLAGVDRASLGVLRGAGFSGLTARPVRMQIAVRATDEGHGGQAGPRTEVRYVVDGREANDVLHRKERRMLLH